jgi:hypothetical protein
MMNETLNKSVNEKDVENTYRHNFLKKFKDMEITSPFGCDGFGVSKSSKVRTLMEFKDNMNLTNKAELVKVLAQSVFYIKRFYDKGIIPPSTIFIGDRDECLTIHVNDILKYLEMDLNWSTAPSQAHTIADLVLALMKDESIQPFVYDSKDFLDCIEKVKDLTDNVQRKVLVTDKNITEVFRYFDEKVLGKNKLTTNERANLFVQILVNKDDNYLHPVKKRKTVVTKSFGEVSLVSREAFESFFGHFSSSYTPSQKHKLAAVVDRIVEDTTRRKQGEFFTPAIWVDKAHEYIASVYGDDWKDKYIVWDPAWGTGNLTRDYKFKELYVSTLNQSDIDTANQMGYNTEAVKFQYDFLNDDYEKLPIGLRDAIEGGKEIIVLMNPPYGAGSELEKKKNKSKSKIADCLLTKEMIQEGYGQSTKQMYSYFFYRFIKMNSSNNINLAVFVPPTFLSGGWFVEFREKLFEKFLYKKGFLFNAKHFDSVSEWGLGFHLLKSGKSLNKKTFVLDVIEQNEDFELFVQNTKTIYNITEKQNLRNFIKPIKDKKTTSFVPLTSVFNVQNNSRYNKHPFLPVNSLGSIIVGGNSVYTNGSALYISSTYTNQGASSPIAVTPENLFRVCMLFSSRTLIKSEWINQKDEYIAPNLNLDETLQFQIDSLIISLFNNSSNQSSLRQIEFQDRLWDIKNEFFWMSVDKMKELSDEKGYDELYNDARTSPDRYVHKLLFGEERIYDKLSPDAKAVLDKATELVEKSMELRQVMANDENHLNSWDAGYAQLKLVWKEYFQEDFKEFRQLYKELENRMRPLVYELGFLLK